MEINISVLLEENEKFLNALSESYIGKVEVDIEENIEGQGFFENIDFINFVIKNIELAVIPLLVNWLYDLLKNNGSSDVVIDEKKYKVDEHFKLALKELLESKVETEKKTKKKKKSKSKKKD